MVRPSFKLHSIREADTQMIPRHKVLPELLESGKLRANNIDLQMGGLEAIPEGLTKLKEGKVSGQKIVYTIG